MSVELIYPRPFVLDEVLDEDRAVQAGSIVYVANNVEHRFHSIEEELTVIVFFAPTEYSRT